MIIMAIIISYNNDNNVNYSDNTNDNYDNDNDNVNNNDNIYNTTWILCSGTSISHWDSQIVSKVLAMRRCMGTCWFTHRRMQLLLLL